MAAAAVAVAGNWCRMPDLFGSPEVGPRRRPRQPRPQLGPSWFEQSIAGLSWWESWTTAAIGAVVVVVDASVVAAVAVVLAGSVGGGLSPLTG